MPGSLSLSADDARRTASGITGAVRIKHRRDKLEFLVGFFLNWLGRGDGAAEEEERRGSCRAARRWRDRRKCMKGDKLEAVPVG